MWQPETTRGAAPTPVPLLVRLLDKLVVEVLPAALASLIGGLLLVHYQFRGPTVAPAAVAGAGAASPEMVQLVRHEHAVLQQLLAAQEAAQQYQMTADAGDAGGPATGLPVAKGRGVLSEAKPRRHRTASAAPLAVTPAPGPAAVIAQVRQIPEAADDRPALIAGTLAATDRVVDAALQAAKAIGGIPLWIGHRLGADSPNPQSAGTPS